MLRNFEKKKIFSKKIGKFWEKFYIFGISVSFRFIFYFKNMSILKIDVKS